MCHRTATRIVLPLISLSAFVLPGGAAAATRPAHHRPLATGQPLPGFPESWGLNPRDLIDIGAGLLIAALLGVVLALRVRRRRREGHAGARGAPVPTFPATAETWRGAVLAEEGGALPRFQASAVVVPPAGRAPGWYPVVGDAGVLAYWDGGGWVASVRWDGQRWVDAAATPAG